MELRQFGPVTSERLLRISQQTNGALRRPGQYDLNTIAIRWHATARETIRPNESGQIELWDGEDTGIMVEGHLMRMHNNREIPDGSEIYADFLPQHGENGQWHIIGRDCPPE